MRSSTCWCSADTAGILQRQSGYRQRIGDAGHGASIWPQSLALAARLAKRYDLAVSTQSGDRPTFFARCRGTQERRARSKATAADERRSSASLLSMGVPRAAGHAHRVEEMLRLADALGIARVAEVVCPGGRKRAEAAFRRAPYAVLHPAPMFRYKRWTDDGWREIAAELVARGLQVVVTGGPAPEERAYLDQRVAMALRMSDGSTARCRGRNSRRCWQAPQGVCRAGYLGDPSCGGGGCADGGAFGPTDPRLWGPWPVGGLRYALGGGGNHPAARATSGWCKIRSPACHASRKAATATS